MGEDNRKPATSLCKRNALIRWTGWNDKEIQYLVETGKLRIHRVRPNSKPKYFVESAQAILDGRAAA